MRRLGILAVLGLAGCQSSRHAVTVDLEAVARAFPAAERDSALPAARAFPLPSQVARLPRLAGAQLALTETKGRLEHARRIVRENRDEALRSLTAALYRAYAAQAEAARDAKTKGLADEIEERWKLAEAEISRQLGQSARRRWPTANRLAFLAGFPFSDPAARPRPENKFDGRRYDEAVAAWKTLREEDVQFAEEVDRILLALEAEVSAKRSDILIEFTRALNEASERAQREAPLAVAGNLPDYMGKFAESADVPVPATSERTVGFEAVSALSGAGLRTAESGRDLRPRNLQHDLSIWLEQNGYRLAPNRTGATDRTREFIQWMESRSAGP